MLKSVKTIVRRGDPPPEIAPYRDAVNTAASRVRGLWLGYIALLAYLFISVGTVTHRDLLLETPVTLPVLNADLPLLGFFVVAPIFLLINQFYLLLQLFGLGRRVADFNEVLATHKLGPSDEHTERRKLDPFFIVQILGGTHDERIGKTSRILRTIATFTLIVSPLVLLLFFQLQFLPYQREDVTWLHRGALLASMVMLWVSWPSIRLGQWVWRFRPNTAPGAGGVLSAFALLAFSVAIATFPGESADGGSNAKNWTRPQDNFLLPVKRYLFGELSGTARSLGALPFQRTLHLPDDRNLIDLDAFDTIRERAKTYTPDATPWETGRTLSLRGRSLRGANFSRSDLRNVDLTDADLQGATLENASLQGASLASSSLQRATLNNAKMQGASLISSNLQSAFAEFANLQGAILDKGHFQGASLFGAWMQGASLEGTRLQGSLLEAVNLHGAHLDSALLEGALLTNARLEGASLDNTMLAGALLDGAVLRGVSLGGANLQGASLRSTFLWRSYGELKDNLLDYSFILSPFLQPPSDSDLKRLEKEVLENVQDRTVQEKIRIRFAEILTSKKGPREELTTSYWKKHIGQIAETKYFAHLALRLQHLACNADGAPHVAQGLIGGAGPVFWSSRLEDIGPDHLPRVARMLLDAAEGRRDGCPGAVGLSDRAIARLHEWTLRDPPP